MEMANRDAHNLQSCAHKSFHKIGIEAPGPGQTDTPTPRNESSRPSFLPCLSYGKTKHKRSNCYFKGATCNKCHKRGHIQTVCKSGRNQNKFRPSKRTPQKSIDEVGEQFTLELFQLVDRAPKFMVPLKIDSSMLKWNLTQEQPSPS
ncbi:hypothetical protein ElyMa_005007400 [Elysia marginata]|uniref:CCHC-type domain-containing protein n=1 Tax=Elysia marginata TaxID=1093978 RepID=A0AAV4JCZ4_9GAST|nr:hypothetical protein ElyMa_005007400 [Elysia marginata]